MIERADPDDPVEPYKRQAPATQEIALPPGVIDKLIEKLIALLWERLLAMLNPDPAPPVVIDPPPVIVQPPPNIDPGPPTVPIRPQESWLRAGIVACYHDWFPGDPDQEVPHGEATPQQVELIRQGRGGLPPGSRVMFDADPMPTNCIEYPFPEIRVTIRNEESGDEQTVSLTKEAPQPDGPVIIQGGETPSSVYVRSSGHRGIFVFDAFPYRASISVEMVASNGAKSNGFGMPWVLKGNGARTASASAASDPFAHGDEVDGFQQRTI